MDMSNELPSLPAGQRWHVRRKRAWLFADRQEKTWYGWRTVRTYDFYEVKQTFALLGSCWL